MRVIVVGAGIVGSSCAYHAAAAGAEVVLVDDGAQGQATAAGAGVVCPWARADPDPDGYRLSVAAAAYYPELAAELAAKGATDPGYVRVGSLHVSTDAAELEATRRRLLDRRNDAPQVGEVTLLPPGHAYELFPPLRSDLGGVSVEGAGRVDGRKVRDALRSTAIDRYGAVERSGHGRAVLSDGRVTGVDLPGERLLGDVVIVAAGAWTAQFCASVGVQIAVEPQRGQIVHAELPGVDTSAWPIIEPPNDHYLLAFPGSRVVFGATRETGSGFDYRATVGGVASVLDSVLSIAPGLAAATIAETRIGFRPLSADGLPLLGGVSSVPGLVVATGMGPTGLTLGPYAGRLVAQLALGQQSDLDIVAFDPMRHCGQSRTGKATPSS